jgi:hypothetical protein
MVASSLLLVSALQLFLPAGAVKPPKPPVTLFQVPRVETPAAAPAAKPRPDVVCGMKIIRANPQIDPKMRVQPPRTDTVFTIRIKKPPVCAQE